MGRQKSQADYVRYTVRVPEALYARLNEAAGEKSVNAEIIERLAGSFNGEVAMQKTKTLTVRLTDEVHARLQSAAKLGPYEISLTTIVERGIELAAQELERMGNTQ